MFPINFCVLFPLLRSSRIRELYPNYDRLASPPSSARALCRVMMAAGLPLAQVQAVRGRRSKGRHAVDDGA